MENIIEIAESLEEWGLLIREIIEIIKNETKEKRGFILKLLGILAFSLLGNILAGQRVIRAGEGTIRAEQDFNAAPFFNQLNLNLMVFIQEILSKVLSKMLSKTKDGVYINNLGSIGTHWIPSYENKKSVTYFDSFGIGHIPKEIKKIHWKWKYYNEYL